MELVTLILSLVSFLTCVGACVFLASRPRHTDAETQSALDELAVTVERLAKISRRERMQAVRAATRDPGAAPAELLAAPVEQKTREQLKREIRARIVGARPTSHRGTQ